MINQKLKIRKIQHFMGNIEKNNVYMVISKKNCMLTPKRPARKEKNSQEQIFF